MVVDRVGRVVEHRPVQMRAKLEVRGEAGRDHGHRITALLLAIDASCELAGTTAPDHASAMHSIILKTLSMVVW